jgi:cytochrome c-type biogenesis protein
MTFASDVSQPGAEDPRLGRRAALAAAAAVAVAIVTVAAALVLQEDAAGLNLAVQRGSSTSTGALNRLAGLLPFGFAFGAGMVASVNPCGFSLLPAYLALFLGGAGRGAGPTPRLVERLLRGAAVTLTVTAAFVLLFSAAGLVLGAGAWAAIGALPWAGFAVGLGLLAGGAYRAGGGQISLGVTARLGASIPAGGSGLRAYFLYGLAYAVTSLGCTLPIFLAVLASALGSGGAASAAVALAAYGLGMGTVIGALTLTLAIVQSAALRRLRGLARHVEAAGTASLFLAGAYLMFYWLTEGGLLGGLS